MADDLPDLPDFDRLQDTPLPPLASPELVRARGVQRRTRSRVLLAGSVLGVMVLGFGSTVALTGGGERSTLTPAAEVATSSDPSPSGTPSPTASSKSPAPSASASPSTSPSPPAPPSPTASAAPGGFIPAEALVAPADLGKFWVRTTSSRGPVEPSLNPCGDGFPDAGSVVARLSGTYGVQDEEGPIPEGSAFGQQVLRYATPAKASAAAAEIRAASKRCAVTTDNGSTTTRAVVDEAPFLVRLHWVDSTLTDPPDWYDYAGVAVSGDLVATWALGDSHGVVRENADRAAASVQKSLCGTGGGGC